MNIVRLGETGLKLSDYLDAVEDEILRDNVGQIYYKNTDGHIISTGKATRTNSMVGYILDRFQIEENNMEAQIYIFPGHPSQISDFISSKLRVPKEELEGARGVLFCDTISSDGKDEASTTTSAHIRTIHLDIDGTETSCKTEVLFDIGKYITSSTNQCTITVTEISETGDFEYEYLIGIYLLILKEV